MGSNRLKVLRYQAKLSYDAMRDAEKKLNRLTASGTAGKGSRIRKLERYIADCEKSYEDKIRTLKVDKRKFETDERYRKHLQFNEGNGNV